MKNYTSSTNGLWSSNPNNDNPGDGLGGQNSGHVGVDHMKR